MLLRLHSLFLTTFALVILTARQTAAKGLRGVLFSKITEKHEERNEDFRESGVRKDKDGE